MMHKVTNFFIISNPFCSNNRKGLSNMSSILKIILAGMNSDGDE